MNEASKLYSLTPDVSVYVSFPVNVGAAAKFALVDKELSFFLGTYGEIDIDNEESLLGFANKLLKELIIRFPILRITSVKACLKGICITSNVNEQKFKK